MLTQTLPLFGALIEEPELGRSLGELVVRLLPSVAANVTDVVPSSSQLRRHEEATVATLWILFGAHDRHSLAIGELAELLDSRPKIESLRTPDVVDPTTLVSVIGSLELPAELASQENVAALRPGERP